MTAPAMRSLHDIGDAQAVLDALVVEHDGELPPDLETLWDQIIGQRDEKVERWGLWLRGQQVQADMIQQEEERLRARRKAVEAAIARGKQGLQYHMERLGVEKVKGKLLTVAIQANAHAVKGDLDLAQLLALHAAASPYVRCVPAAFTLDRKAILEAYKAGQSIPDGLTVEQSSSIRIR